MHVTFGISCNYVVTCQSAKGKLLHGPSLVAVGLSVVYETWYPFDWHPFRIDCSKYRCHIPSPYVTFGRGHWRSPCSALTHQELACARRPWKSLGERQLNTLGPRQNGRHFADDTFKSIFMNENVRISINISLKLVPKGLINNIPA